MPPLPLPAGSGTASVAEVAASPAVALFVDRARAVRPGFALTEGNAAAVAEICRRLEGLPLAIELAAARTRLLDPPALLDRLAASLDALGTGAVDMPARQRTLRATVEWSVGLLTDAERSCWRWRRYSVTAGHSRPRPRWRAWMRTVCWTCVRRWPGTVWSTSTAPGPGPGRGCWRPSASSWPSGWRPALTPPRSAADTPAFTGRWPSRRTGRCAARARASGWSGCAPRQATWPPRCAGTWPKTPGRCHTCSGSCGCSGRRRTWSARPGPGWSSSLPAVGTLDPQARAELAWAAAVLAVDAGDDAAALAARQRLAPLLAGISDPLLHAVAQLAMAWTLPIAGDFDGALREAVGLAGGAPRPG